MPLTEIIKKTLPPLIIWLAISFLLIYSGNGITFSAIIGALGSLPFIILDALAGKSTTISSPSESKNLIANIMNLIWIIIFLYTLLELFEITSSEVILTVMILILVFSKWKETTTKIYSQSKQ